MACLLNNTKMHFNQREHRFVIKSTQKHKQEGKRISYQASPQHRDENIGSISGSIFDFILKYLTPLLIENIAFNRSTSDLRRQITSVQT